MIYFLLGFFVHDFISSLILFFKKEFVYLIDRRLNYIILVFDLIAIIYIIFLLKKNGEKQGGQIEKH